MDATGIVNGLLFKVVHTTIIVFVYLFHEVLKNCNKRGKNLYLKWISHTLMAESSSLSNQALTKIH